MNLVILTGRLATEPEGRTYKDESTGKETSVCQYTLAVNREYANSPADFIKCKTYGKNAEISAKYMSKGMKVTVIGKIRISNYTNKEGKKVYVTDVVVNSQEFIEGKNKPAGDSEQEVATAEQPAEERPAAPDDGFMDVPDGVEQDLPFR